VHLTRRRVFILPTRHGLAYGLTLLVMLVGTVNYDNSLGYMLTFLLASLALVSILHTYKNLAALTLRAGRIEPVFAGSLARFPLYLANREHPSRHAIQVIAPRRLPATETANDVVTKTVVPGRVVHRVEVSVEMVRRGWNALGGIVVSSRYPFGLFRAWSNVDLEVDCLVYPRPDGRSELPLNRDPAAHEQGHAGQGRDDFSGLREYLPGDSPRQIHWKAAAREQGMPVKIFSGATAAEVVLRWQDVPARETEARLSQLCRWVLTAERGGIRYGLRIPGATVATGTGAAHRQRCLEALALYGFDSPRPAAGVAGGG